METNKCSVDEVVGRVIRNTRLADSSYHDDILTWITEACADMKTKWTLRQVFMDKDVYFYKAEMPCGLVTLTAIEYNGLRLRQRNMSVSPAVIPEEVSASSDTWISMVKKTESPNGNTAYEPESIILPVSYTTEEWYQEDGPGFIATSFKDGLIRFHYKETPHDKHGMPLIPDQENYKEALYWYCRMKMIESGWADPVLDWSTCDQKYSVNAERGRAAVKYPSVARAEEMADMLTLIPPPNYFANFGNIYQ